MPSEVETKGQVAKIAALKSAILPSQVREKVLLAMADAVDAKRDEIKDVNQKDVKAAREKHLSATLIDRLILNDSRITEMAKGLREVAAMPDHIGDITKMWKRPNGLLIGKMVVPLGVIGIIYEARPNVTVDAAGLCIKAGNTIILRGGSEAVNSNIFLARLLEEAAVKAGYPAGSIQIIENTDRALVTEMLKARKFIDVIIPRGGAEFIEMVVKNAQVPVIETGAGNCHTYIDKNADLDQALEIVFNAKVQRPSVCNATKKILVHKDVASKFLPMVRDKLGKAGVLFLTDDKAQKFFPDAPKCTEAEWYEEFIDMRLGIKIVESAQEAIDHINKYSSHHTEAILTKDYSLAMEFINVIDSSTVMWNTSTRFTDGAQFGLGAEMGISTQKLHWRGPMSYEQLTCEKFVVLGQGQVRQ
jgi:glutamate-5-semialdehyde dehydrogenase